jgi:carboxypeptidase family protein/TonB-dependent receptor-like protein
MRSGDERLIGVLENKEKRDMKFRSFNAVVLLCSLLIFCARANSQQVVGAITGTVTDPTGAAVPDAMVKAINQATNLEITAKTGPNGSYSIPALPAGSYKMSFTKEGFKSEEHTEVLVNANRTTTVDSSLVVGTVTAMVEVTAVPLMNQVDTTSGYVVDNLTIQNTPLGTGSFTQLAILSPGVHADFLGGGGANTGLGNQAIFADGNRDTSNSFSLNGVSTNNLFNGNSTSQVGENRFVLNTGETFNAGGVIETSTSVYSAIGQALPTPPPDAIQEIAVNTSMYDVSQGNNSGAHIGVLTKSGGNAMHGSIYWQYQSSAMNANPFFYNADPAIPLVTRQNPFLNRNQFGATLGGPIQKDKLFYFVSYQGVRIADAQPSLQTQVVPFGLTDDRSIQGIVNAMNASYFEPPIDPIPCGPGQTPPNPCFQASQINSAALQILQAKLPNGQLLIPSANPALSQTAKGQSTAVHLGLDAFAIGPNTLSGVDQGIADVDYAISDKDRLSLRYYVQQDPTSGPFGADDYLLGFPQQLSAGSQVISIANTTTLSPNLTWEQHVGFTRLHAYASDQQAFTPASLGITLLPGASFPNIEISHGDPNFNSGGVQFGPSPSFGNAGMYQNQWEYGTSMNWVKGKHTLSFGAMWDHAQLNIVNNNTKTDTLQSDTFLDFVEGNLHGGDEFAGAASRYYRSDTIGAYAGDSFKLRSNLTITAGLRWDYDGPLTEKYGKLTALNPAAYKYIPCASGGAPADPTAVSCDAGTDVIANSGFEISGSSSKSLMNARQWAFAPRIGIAWSPFSKLTLRAGYGIFNDRGEFFTYLSPSAGSGFNGPFGVTLAPPFVSVVSIGQNATLSDPFGSAVPPPPAGTVAAFQATLPNLKQTACGFPGSCYPPGNLFGPVLFGGYDVNNKLPYMQNWTFDLQYQASNNWLFDIGYVGNHGTHLVVPIPFNQPLIATSTHPVNGQIYSYGGTPCYAGESGLNPSLCQYPFCCTQETVFTNEFSGNAPTRVPYPGYDMNSVLYEAAGTSNYDALQLQVKKRLSSGLQFTASYTYSHALDEQSGLGLFFTGNNPLDLKANYASADFDQTHVFLINYSYTTPSFVKNAALGKAVNGWTIGGQTVAQSGQPYSVYDYSGSVGSLYYGTSDYITNPIVPLKPGVTPKQAQLQGTTGINAGSPVLNAADFLPQFVAPGTNGVPACDSSGCDLFESLFGSSGRNLFRGPFQVRFDMSLAKQFPIRERFQLRFEVDAFNIFNHPDFDTPNNDVNFFPNFTGPPQIPPAGSLGMIQHTIGSPRFLQLVLHLAF